MMQVKKLEKPDLGQIPDPSLREMAINYKVYENIAGNEYLYWDKLKYKKIGGNASLEALWLSVKKYRKTYSIDSPIENEKGDKFWWIKQPKYDYFFHELDLKLGGSLAVDSNIKSGNRRKQQFISRGILEEAIASSQLEGANTTRRVAKELLQSGRKPANKSEQMIVNNFRVMSNIERDYKDKPLSVEMLFEMHALITEKTLPERDVGRFRRDSDEIAVFGPDQEEILYIPPKMEFVESQMERLIQFANEESREKGFVHPLIKAVILHFWIGYLHPFCDGNGRIARLLFYWYMMRKGYWAFAYLPISSIIKKSPAQYQNAYLYSEQDDLDLTYFIDYNIQKIIIAQREFESYKNKMELRYAGIQSSTLKDQHFNRRQIDLLQYFIEHPDQRTTPSIHKNTHQVTKLTAIHDLKEMVENGFLVSKKEGRNVFYYPTDKIREAIQS